MKKYIFLILLFVLILTGCGKQKLKCTKEEKKNDTKIKYVLNAIVEIGRVTEAKAQIKFGNETDANNYCEMLNKTNTYSNEKKIKYSCDNNIVEIDDYLDIEEIAKNITRTKFIEKMEQEGYNCE